MHTMSKYYWHVLAFCKFRIAFLIVKLKRAWNQLCCKKYSFKLSGVTSKPQYLFYEQLSPHKNIDIPVSCERMVTSIWSVSVLLRQHSSFKGVAACFSIQLWRFITQFTHASKFSFLIASQGLGLRGNCESYSMPVVRNNALPQWYTATIWISFKLFLTGKDGSLCVHWCVSRNKKETAGPTCTNTQRDGHPHPYNWEWRWSH